MTEKITSVKNPLTIIAVFAGIAEISGTVVLPFVEKEVQVIYVWFLMGFPTLLVILFFFTLLKNHRVLYAPSDFRSDEGFLQGMIRDQTPQEQAVRVVEEVVEAKTQSFTNSQVESSDGSEPQTKQENGKSVEIVEKIGQEISDFYVDRMLLLEALEQEFKARSFRKQVTIRGKIREPMTLDGIAIQDVGTTAIEVRPFNNPVIAPHIREAILKKARQVLDMGSRFLFAAITDMPREKKKKLSWELEEITRHLGPAVETRVYHRDDLRAWKA